MKKRVGAATLLLFEGKIGLLLRDDDPQIPWPNTWAPPGGGQEDGENLLETAQRELLEELNIEPDLTPVGVTPRGNGIFISNLSKGTQNKIKKNGEGQRFQFFRPEELDQLKFGGEFRILFMEKSEIVKEMVSSGIAPSPEELGWSIWSGQ